MPRDADEEVRTGLLTSKPVGPLLDFQNGPIFYHRKYSNMRVTSLRKTEQKKYHAPYGWHFGGNGTAHVSLFLFFKTVGRHHGIALHHHRKVQQISERGW